MGHTPGAWSIQDAPSLRMGSCLLWPQVWSLCGPRIALCELQNVGREEARANAVLLAAAPDLLVALQGILAGLLAEGDDITHAGRIAFACTIANGAIAKAEGRG